MEMFRCGLLAEGDELLSKLRGTRTEVGGFLSVLDQEEVTVVPTLAAQCMCGGPLEQTVWEMLRDKLLNRLAQALPVHGVLLSMHGAMVAENEDDCCGALLVGVRRVVGPDLPVIVVLDMHGNLTRQLVENATAIIAYKTHPHRDFKERGEQAARLLLRTIRGEVRPVMAMTPLPMILGIETALQLELIAEGAALEESGEILASSVMYATPGLDVEDHQALSALVVTDNDLERARRLGQQLMWKAWQQRHRVKTDRQTGLPLPEAISKALEHPPGTVVMADWGDAITAGLPGDNAELVAHLLERGVKERACLMINDPDLVRRSISAGVGNTVRGPIGGRWGAPYYKPVPVDGRIRLLFDGLLPPSHEDNPGHLIISNTSMGQTAVVQVGESITVIATSVPVAQTEPTVFRAVGVEPSDYRIVLCKTVLQHRMHFAPIAVGFIDLATGRFGENKSVLGRQLIFPFKKRDPKSAYPFRDFSDSEIRHRLGMEV
jgi:microcystin degradation protein MlrC